MAFKLDQINKNYKGCILKRIQKTYEKFQQKPLPYLFKAKLDGPSTTWKVFSRLQMAMEYADSCTKNCMIFAFEEKVSNNGQRMYLVAHPEHFWHNYRLRHAEERCTYEVIRENIPSKLYFDLEYYTSVNNDKNGNHMAEIFIKCVIAFMHEQHALLLEDSEFLWLDASSDTKFSCHLIVQMKGIAFQNNLHAGMFVSLLLSTLRKRIKDDSPSEGLWPSSEEIKTLLVKSKKDKEVFFCDEAVYSKNRNFRLFLSTKSGENRPLILSSQNKYEHSVNSKCKDESLFYDSLVTNFGDGETYELLSYESDQTGLSSHSRRTQGRLGVSGSTSSPFPELDNFILKVIKDEFAVGFIRRWTYHSNVQKIIYDIGNYRFCGNIGRHHKSNNIRIIVDMNAKCYNQMCLDPDCRQENYLSESTTIPEDILFVNVPDDFFDESCFSQELPSQEVEMENNNNVLFCPEKGNSDCIVSSGDSPKDTKDSCDITNHSIKICYSGASVPHEEFEDLGSDFDFSEFCSRSPKRTTDRNSLECDNNKELHFPHHQDSVEDSWNAFFVGDFAYTQDTLKTNQEVYGKLDGGDEHWICDSPMKDATLSHEEEMLLAEAAEAAEATMSQSIFSEETVF